MRWDVSVDPRNKYSIAIKAITKKGSKKITEADLEERDRLEWESGLYWDEKDGVVIPSDNIEKCIKEGAQKSRAGKDVAAAVLCTTPHAVLQYRNRTTDKDKLYSYGPESSFRKPVGINDKRIMRVRPWFPTGWNISFELEYEERVIEESTLKIAMVNAGSLIGLGEWRPKFGRFEVT